MRSLPADISMRPRIYPQVGVQDPPLPNTFSTLRTTTLRFGALPCVCCRIVLYGIKAASGGVGVAESMVQLACPPGRSRTLRAA